MRRVEIRPEATADIREIWQWIEDRDQDPTNADKVISEIDKAIHTVARVPGVGHSRKDVRQADYRFRNVYSYLIVYKYDKATVTIIRVVHGARDFTKLF